jgi:hypothetical protein
MSTQKGSPNLIPVDVRRIQLLLYSPGFAGAFMVIRMAVSGPGMTFCVRKYAGLSASSGPPVHTALYSVVHVHSP